MKKTFIKTAPSLHNKEIEILKEKNGYSVLVNGITQSGFLIEALFDEAFAKLLPNTTISSVLILGFGAGSVTKSIRKHWPAAKITGIELDPVMIDIAKTYFPEHTKDTIIKNGDAISYVTKKNKNIVYDLVLFDCYIGQDSPKTAQNMQFFINLKKMGRIVLFNQLFLPNNPKEIQKIAFFRQLDKYYPVQALKLKYNIVFKY